MKMVKYENESYYLAGVYFHLMREHNTVLLFLYPVHFLSTCCVRFFIPCVYILPGSEPKPCVCITGL